MASSNPAPRYNPSPPLCLPTYVFEADIVIRQPGRYLTHRGEIVTVESVPDSNHYRADGRYPNGIRESWKKDGRVLSPHYPSNNDIIGPAPTDLPESSLSAAITP